MPYKQMTGKDQISNFSTPTHDLLFTVSMERYARTTTSLTQHAFVHSVAVSTSSKRLATE
jgi:hypothetical protein